LQLDDEPDAGLRPGGRGAQYRDPEGEAGDVKGRLGKMAPWAPERLGARHSLPRRMRWQGCCSMAVGVLALVLGADLPMGTLRAMGAGMLPKSLATMLVGAGGLLVVFAFLTDGAGLERWHLRGPIFIVGSVAVFALTIRTLGLDPARARPRCSVSSFAADDVRWKEAIIFSVAMAAFCILLFKVLLGLPIPVVAFLSRQPNGHARRSRARFCRCAHALRTSPCASRGCMIGTLIGVLAAAWDRSRPSRSCCRSPSASIRTGALIMLAGIYYGAQYGGSTHRDPRSNVPGEATSVVTVLDGHQMAKQGRAGVALGIAAIGSFFAGCVATLFVARARRAADQARAAVSARRSTSR